VSGPIPAATLHVTLPRSTAVTHVLLNPPHGSSPETALAGCRDHIERELRTVRRSAPAGRSIRIDSYRVQLALEAPHELQWLERSFSPSAAACRRAIGIEIVSKCLTDATQPAAQVAGVLAAAGRGATTSVERSWWGDWFATIPPAGRAAATSEALTWATQLFGALDWSRLTDARIGEDRRWDCPGAQRVAVHAKVDVRIEVDGRPVFFLMPTGVPGPNWWAPLALSALVTGLVDGPTSVPARVVALWPASGQVRILDLEPETLERAASTIADTFRAMSGSGTASGRPRAVRTL
jgi:hypothetical protein